ncbi:hypothetical protein A3465_01165 [Enterobacter roggenkampii]|nr:hypothetical protein A3465_01165 [Enterobacter roggenkampii]
MNLSDQRYFRFCKPAHQSSGFTLELAFDLRSKWLTFVFPAYFFNHLVYLLITRRDYFDI